MNRAELHDFLVAEGVCKDSFSVVGSDEYPPTGIPNQHRLAQRRSGIIENPDFFETFFFDERGGISNLKRHATEAEACQAFIELVMPTARLR